MRPKGQCAVCDVGVFCSDTEANYCSVLNCKLFSHSTQVTASLFRGSGISQDVLKDFWGGRGSHSSFPQMYGSVSELEMAA